MIPLKSLIRTKREGGESGDHERVMSVSNVFTRVVGQVTYLIVTSAYTGRVIIRNRIRRVADSPDRDQ